MQSSGDTLTLGVGGRPHARIQAVLGVVGLRDRLLDAGDRIDRDQRAECLTAGALHVLGDTGQHGGFVEQRADIESGLTAGDHCGALGFCVLDMVGHRLELTF